MKNWILAFFITLFISVNLFSQGVWTQKASFPGSARGDAFSFSLGTKGYIIAGSNSNSWFNDVWEYNASSNSWSQKQNFISTARWQGVSFNIGAKGYIGTGQDGSSIQHNDFWQYNPATDSWTQKANVPTTGRNFAVGFSIGNKGYIGTGLNGTSVYFHDLWEYDTLANTWSQKADFPAGGRLTAVGLSIGTKGYIGLGKDSIGTFKNDFWEYDPISDSWTQKTNYAGGIREEMDGSHFIIGSYGYVGTGRAVVSSSWVYYNDFWEYNPSNDSWVQILNYPGNARIGASNFSINNKGYIGLGFIQIPVLTAFNDLWEFTPDSTENVNEINFDNCFSVSPNPTTGKIEIQNPNYKMEKIKMFNALGEKVVETRSSKLDISNQPSGVYFVHITCKEGTAVKKIILNK